MHECPECYSMCHCHGDIDDLLLNRDEYVDGCECCPIDGNDDPEDEEYLE